MLDDRVITLGQRARIIYRAIKADSNALTKVTAALNALATADVDGEERLNVSSFTVNGQQFSGESLDAGEWAAVLEMVQWMLTNSAALSTRVTRRSFF